MKTRTRKKMQKERRKKLLLIIGIILICIVAKLTIFDKNKTNKEIDAELAKAMTYNELKDEDFKTQSDCVNFGAFFLRDLNGDGYAEKVAGTCREIGKTDTLYFNISVNSEGILKNGVISINGQNFELKTAIVKDSVIKNNIISNNTSKIELNDIPVGTTKLLMGTVTNKISSALDYSKTNTVTLTGTYVDATGKETKIEKVIELTVDWYGYLNTQIKTTTETAYANEGIDIEEGTIDLKFKITTEETKKELILTENNVKITIPELNGYKAVKVELEGTNGETTYNRETGEFEIIRKNSKLPSTNAYTVIVTYPLEAYEKSTEETISIQMPVESYYIGENNPSEEFENPLKSNIANKTVTVVVEKEKIQKSESPEFNITVGKYATQPTGRYVVSKSLPLKRYSGEEITQNTEYNVQWKAWIGTERLNGLKLEQTNEDKIHNNKTGQDISMAEYASYTGIYILSGTAVLGEDGYINVINAETNETIHTFTSEDWDKYTASAPYKYDIPVKNIRIETSSANENTTLIVNNIKEINDKKITTDYTETDFESLTKINSYLTGTIIKNTETTKKISNTASYEGEISLASIKISKQEMSTQDTEENEIITIATQTNGYNTAKWKNGAYIVKFPSNIVNVEINNVKISDSSVKILGYEVYKEGENQYIKIVTSNEVESTYEISIDCNLESDPRISTTTGNIELYASNENCDNYEANNRKQDIYDVNSNLNKEENVGYAYTSITTVAPGLLTTAQIASEYDDEGNVTLAPQIAEILPEVIVDKEDEVEQTAKITVQIMNNYVGTISETKIIGKIPFEGNKDDITGKDLGSTYTTQMKNTGISVPEKLKGKVTIYYSENENPTKDITDSSNGWTTVPEDWSKVKTYLIDFNDYVLSSKEECLFTYEIVIPKGLNYNQISYSLHIVEFCLDTDQGKLRQEIEPRKLGFRIARKYDLELTKYRKGTDQHLSGVTFKLTEVNENNEEIESKVRATDANGILRIDNLYVERTYVLKEIKTLEEYELSDEEIKFTSSVDESGKLCIEILSGGFKDNKIEIIPTEMLIDKSNPTVKVSLENEIKYNLEINKLDKDTKEKIRGVKFRLTEGENTKNLVTNSKGQINLKGLKLGTEYTLEEKSAEGYYLLEQPVKFKLLRNETGEIDVSVSNNRDDVTYTKKEVEGTICPTLELDINNTKIPTYNMEVLKVEAKTDVTAGDTTNKVLEGAQFELYSYDQDKKEIYTTNAEGKISLQGLYEYVEGKNITGKYSLKEIYAPEGYAVNGTELIFRAERKDGNLTLTVIEGQDLISDGECNGVAYDENGTEITTKEITVENTTVGITVKDESIFSLSKTDSVTGEPVEGAKFAIYKIDENNEIVEPAKDIQGNTLGEKQTINGNEYYVLKTDSAGRITGNLGEGLYKAVEVEVPEGYVFEQDEEKRTEYFGIGQSKPAEREINEIWDSTFQTEGTIKFNDSAKTNDGGYVVVGTYSRTITIPAEMTATGEEITKKSYNNSEDGIVIKYNSEDKIEWVNCSDGKTVDSVKSVDVNSEGKIFTVNPTEKKVLIFNNNGLLEETSSYASLDKIKATSDRGYILVGGSTKEATIPAENTKAGEQIDISHAGDFDGIVIKVDQNNLVEWVHHINYEGRNRLQAIEEINENEYVVGGYIGNNHFPLVIPANETADGIEEISIGEKVSGGYSGIKIVYNEKGLVKSATTLGNDGIASILKTEDGYINMEGSGKYDNYDIVSTKLVKTNLNNETEWSSSYINSIQKVIKTSDNGYLAMGSISAPNTILGQDTITGEEIQLNNNGETDAIIVKYNSNGKIEWAKSLGSMGADSYVSAVEKNIAKEDGTQEIQYIVTGNFSGVSKEIDGLIGAVTVIYNSSGEIVSNKSMYESRQNIFDVVNTDDGGSIAVGRFSGKLEIAKEQTAKEEIELYSNGGNDGLVIKYNSDGKIEWAKKMGGISNEEYKAIDNVDGGFVTVGTYYGKLIIPAEDTTNNKEIVLEGYWNGYGIIVRYNKDGKIEFVKRIPGNTSSINDVKRTEDGYVVVGNSGSNVTIDAEDTTDGSEDIVLSATGTRGIIIKYDNNNKVKWAKAGEDGSKYTKISYKNSEYVAIGSLYNSKNIIVKYEESGNVKFSNTLDVVYNNQYVKGVIQPDDGGTIVVGSQQSNLTIPAEQTVDGKEIILPSGGFKGYIVKYNSEGLVEMAKAVVDEVSPNAYIQDIFETEDGGYAIVIGGNKGFKILAKNTADNKEINVSTKGNSGKILKFNKDNKFEWYKDLEKYSSYFQMSIYISDNRYMVATNVNNSSTWLSSVQLDILSPEVPKSKLVEVQNTPLTYKITGEVQGEGGTITIGNNLPQETVSYNKDSTEDIVIKPSSEEYQVTSITVNDEPIPFTPDENGVVTLEKFKNVLLNKHIVVKFSKVSEISKILVHHYLWKDGAGSEEKISADEYVQGEIGSSYVTAPKVDLEGYELITNKDILGEGATDPDEYYIPDNATGNIAENIVVTYYYKVKTYNLTIHHYLEGTETSIAPTVIKAGIDTGTNYKITVEKNENQKYKITTTLNTTSQEKELEIDERRYKKTLVVGEENGNITKDTEITYYYVDTAIDLSIEKIWEDNNNKGSTRPENLEIQVLGNKEIIDSYTLNVANNENTHIFQNMYKYAEDESELKYNIQEAQIPEGYYIKATSEQNNNYTITNAKLGSITVIKADKKTKEKLKGAEIKIEKQDGENWIEIGKLITDENGQAQISKLEHGKYRITETKAPEGYELNTKSQEIEINANQVDYEIEIQDKAKTELPTAGGRGIYLNIAIGVIIVLGGIKLFKKKSKH